MHCQRAPTKSEVRYVCCGQVAAKKNHEFTIAGKLLLEVTKVKYGTGITSQNSKYLTFLDVVYVFYKVSLCFLKFPSFGSVSGPGYLYHISTKRTRWLRETVREHMKI